MGTIDFAAVKKLVTMRHALIAIGVIAGTWKGEQFRSKCPIHNSSTKGNKTFSANVRLGKYHCFKCKSFGDALDLYVACTPGATVHTAAIELCHVAGVEIPYKSKGK